MQAGGCRFDAGRFHQVAQRAEGTQSSACKGVWQRGSLRQAVTLLSFGTSFVRIEPHPPAMTPRSAAGSALALGARGRQFEPGRGDQDHALLTQLARVLPCLGRCQRFESAAGRQTNQARTHLPATNRQHQASTQGSGQASPPYSPVVTAGRNPVAAEGLPRHPICCRSQPGSCTLSLPP